MPVDIAATWSQMLIPASMIIVCVDHTKMLTQLVRDAVDIAADIRVACIEADAYVDRVHGTQIQRRSLVWANKRWVACFREHNLCRAADDRPQPDSRFQRPILADLNVASVLLNPTARDQEVALHRQFHRKDRRKNSRESSETFFSAPPPLTNTIDLFDGGAKRLLTGIAHVLLQRIQIYLHQSVVPKKGHVILGFLWCIIEGKERADET